MFSKYTFKQSVGWICCVLGIAAYVIGYFCLNVESILSRILINIADVLIIGVVVGYLSSVAQWSGVFKKEIQDIVFGHKFIGERKDIEQIWSDVTRQLLKNKFAGIHKDILGAIRATAIPPDNIISYYEDYDYHIELSWVDRKSGLINSCETVTFTLVAESDNEIKLPVKTWTVLYTAGEDLPWDKEKIKIEYPKIKVDKETPQISNNEPIQIDNQLVQESEVLLKGKKRYLVSYTRNKTYYFKDDFFIGFKSQYITKNINVTLCIPDDIRAVFIERGSHAGFTEVKRTKNCIKMALKDVIFPKQGFIFALHED